MWGRFAGRKDGYEWKDQDETPNENEKCEFDTVWTVSLLKKKTRCPDDCKEKHKAGLPFIASSTIDLAKDFEVPGFPTMKRGILNSAQITIKKTFSVNA